MSAYEENEEPIGSSDPGRRQSLKSTIIEETALLDDRRLEEWLGYLAPEVEYHVPVTVDEETSGATGFSEAIEHFCDTYQTLSLRVRRLGTAFAWAETPPSRTRHFLGNFRFTRLPNDYWKVCYYVLLMRSRGSGELQALSGKREDLWRPAEGERGWQLVRRITYLDQSVLDWPTLSVLL